MTLEGRNTGKKKGFSGRRREKLTGVKTTAIYCAFYLHEVVKNKFKKKQGISIKNLCIGTPTACETIIRTGKYNYYEIKKSMHSK